MTRGRFAPQARRELRQAAEWIAEESPDAAVALVQAVVRAADRVAARPALARTMPQLAPDRFRFWSLRGFPYLLVFDTARTPPIVARMVHQARDLPAALGSLED